MSNYQNQLARQIAAELIQKTASESSVALESLYMQDPELTEKVAANMFQTYMDVMGGKGVRNADQALTDYLTSGKFERAHANRDQMTSEVEKYINDAAAKRRTQGMTPAEYRAHVKNLEEYGDLNRLYEDDVNAAIGEGQDLTRALQDERTRRKMYAMNTGFAGAGAGVLGAAGFADAKEASYQDALAEKIAMDMLEKLAGTDEDVRSLMKVQKGKNKMSEKDQKQNYRNDADNFRYNSTVHSQLMPLAHKGQFEGYDLSSVGSGRKNQALEASSYLSGVPREDDGTPEFAYDLAERALAEDAYARDIKKKEMIRALAMGAGALGGGVLGGLGSQRLLRNMSDDVALHGTLMGGLAGGMAGATGGLLAGEKGVNDTRKTLYEDLPDADTAALLAARDDFAKKTRQRAATADRLKMTNTYYY